MMIDPCPLPIQHWWNWHPPVGTSVVILGVMGVLVPLFRKWEEIRPLEKALWTTLFFGLAWFEIHTLYIDRNEHDAEQAHAACEQTEKFGQIAGKIQAAIDTNQAEFSATMQSLDENLKTVTGGEGYCYFMFGNESPDGSIALLMALAKGRYPLRNVTARLVNQTTMREMQQKGLPVGADTGAQRIVIGDIGVNQVSTIGWQTLGSEDKLDFIAQFSGLNGNWEELIKMRKVDGTWQEAVKVFRWVVVNKNKPVQEKILLAPKPSAKFPLVNGKVDWAD